VPTDLLTGRERAILLTLMAEARTLTNKDMHATAGLKLDGESRRRLNERKLVETLKVGRSLVHELTDDGWKWCRDELSRARPAGSGSYGGAMYALLSALDRLLVLRDEQLSDLFHASVEHQVRTVYADLAGEPGEWVGLVRLRSRLGGVPRAVLDAELERMTVLPGVHLQQEPNLKALTDDDRTAAVRFGGDDRHMIMIEAG
jgi:hypothetical protein